VSDVTRLLDAVERGEPQAAEELLPLVYEQLRRLAAAKMANEKPGHTLQATALVHEAWLELAGSNQGWEGRAHFFAAAAEAMRRILIHDARRKQSLKRGAGVPPEQLHESRIAVAVPADELLAVHEALERLEKQDAQAALLVKLRYFVGLSRQDAAEQMGISPRSADRLWAYARVWLHREMGL
jgi:RNA polymerase sigma factor (TIGR02999 family)